jgi:hypothetical protein
MAVYTVHEPPSRAGASAPERFVFVRDAFSWAALLFGPLWMLWHRMWLVLLGYLAVTTALALVLHLQGSAGVGTIVWGLLALLLGFEAGTLRRFTLGRRGFRNIGIVVGDDLELAERRFFDSWIRKSSADESRPSGERSASSAAPALTPTARMPHASSDVAGGSHILGLFPEPGTPP